MSRCSLFWSQVDLRLPSPAPVACNEKFLGLRTLAKILGLTANHLSDHLIHFRNTRTNLSVSRIVSGLCLSTNVWSPPSHQPTGIRRLNATLSPRVKETSEFVSLGGC